MRARSDTGHGGRVAETSASPVVAVHVKARASTAQALRIGQIHELGDVEVSVSNWAERDAAGPVHRGLFFDAQVRAATIDAAVDVAMRAADGVLSSLCFASATGAGP